MELHQTKRAVIYCRVSTKEQAEEGNSLVTQEKHCREFAYKNGYEIVSVFIEQGESAKTIDRTELKKLLAFCSLKKNGIKAVIAYKLDRISRNTDDYSQIRILLKRYGVEIKSTSEYFEDTPAGRFMENIIANVAQFDNDVRAERCAGGMKDAAREGRYVWQAPFGYSNVKVNGKATIAPNDKSVIIRKTFEQISLNRFSIVEIRRQMALDGLVGRNGKPLAQSYFYRLLKNEVYIGVINKFGEKNRGAFEAIVPEEVFWKVQEVLFSRTRRNTRKFFRFNPDFPLSRFVFHPNNRKLTGYWAKGRQKKYPYYTFHSTKLIFRKEQLEKRFAEWLDQFKISVTKFEYLHKALTQQLVEKSNFLANKESIEKHVSDLRKKQNILVEKNLSGVISDEILKSKLIEINFEIEQGVKQLNQNSTIKEINIEETLRITRETLLNPGKIWLEAPARIKVELQWFYFPGGIEYAENESRTTKICSLFKHISNISPLFSLKVDNRLFNSNTTNSRKYKEPDRKEVIYELHKLTKIIEEVKEEEDNPLLPA